MSYVSKDDENLNYLKIQNNCKNLNVLEEKEEIQENIETNSMLNVMNGLISSMQQLQRMFIDQISKKEQETTSKQKENNLNVPKPKTSQTERLLQQVQSAMESTIVQLSNRDSVTNSTDKPAEKEQSISTKWRLYTEMYQLKNESSKDYCLKKMKLGQDLGLSFKETKREMLIGLWSNRLAIVLYLTQHGNEEELVKEIEDWERIENGRNEVFKKHRNKNCKNSF